MDLCDPFVRVTKFNNGLSVIGDWISGDLLTVDDVDVLDVVTLHTSVFGVDVTGADG